MKIDGEENKSDVQKELPEMRMNLAKEHFPVESKSSSAKPTADATLQGETLLATAALKLNKTTENESPQLVKKEDVEDGQKPVMKEAKKDEEIKCKDTLKEDNAEKREKGEDKPKKEEKQHKTRNAEVKTKKQEEETQKEKQNDQKDEKKKKTKTKKKREKNKRSPKDS